MSYWLIALTIPHILSNVFCKMYYKFYIFMLHIIVWMWHHCLQQCQSKTKLDGFYQKTSDKFSSFMNKRKRLVNYWNQLGKHLHGRLLRDMHYYQQFYSQSVVLYILMIHLSYGLMGKTTLIKIWLRSVSWCYREKKPNTNRCLNA